MRVCVFACICVLVDITYEHTHRQRSGPLHLRVKQTHKGYMDVTRTFVESVFTHSSHRRVYVLYYGVATMSRLLKILGLFCKRAL